MPELGPLPKYRGNDQFLQGVSRFLEQVFTALQYTDLVSVKSNSFISDEVTIAAGTEVLISSKLPKILMSYMLPVSLSNANAILTKGPTTWTKRQVSVKNQGTESVTAKILFMA